MDLIEPAAGPSATAPRHSPHGVQQRLGPVVTWAVPTAGNVAAGAGAVTGRLDATTAVLIAVPSSLAILYLFLDRILLHREISRQSDLVATALKACTEGADGTPARALDALALLLPPAGPADRSATSEDRPAPRP